MTVDIVHDMYCTWYCTVRTVQYHRNHEKSSERPVLWACNKNSHVCMFLPNQKKTLFYLLFKFSRFNSKFRKIKVSKRCQQTRYFAPKISRIDERKVHLTEALERTKKTSFFARVMTSSNRMESLSNYQLSKCQRFFHSKRFPKSVPPFQRYCLAFSFQIFN